METDVNETPTEETSEETTEESSTPEQTEQTVPYDRFKKVNDEKKELEQKLEDSKPQPQSKEQQAEEYLDKLVDKRLDKRDEAAKAAETKEQKKFDSDVDDLLTVHTDVKKEEFLKFIDENGDKYGVTSVKGAMALYKDLGNIKKETAEEAKDSLKAKPGLPKSEAIPGSVKTPEDDKGKSLEQIKEEAIAELEAK